MSPKMKRLPLLILAILLLAGGAYFALRHAGTVSTDDATLEAAVVPIAPKVEGYVSTLNVRDNQEVKKGDLLLQIDPRDYEIARDKFAAALASAKADWIRADAELTRLKQLSNAALSRQGL